MEKLITKYNLGNTTIKVPPIIFGTSCLGNLYEALSDNVKLEIIKEWFEWVEAPVVIDTAGKYGAGLALEVIGNGLRKLNIDPDKIIISNKLGWYRIPLTTPEPTFEPGIWANIKNDAIQKISYKGIIECYEQGCELLGGDYNTDIISVHDPDEYLALASNEMERREKMHDILAAYHALKELKDKGRVKAIGVGSKDWKVIKELTDQIGLDWVMLAVSLTIMNHPEDLLNYIKELTNKGVGIINSAVFHGGFLTGGDFFDYRKVERNVENDKELFIWRDKFYEICNEFDVLPSEACVQFGLTPHGIISIALNTSKPDRVKKNVNAVQAKIPKEFWRAMQENNLIDINYPFLNIK